ncbi:MAG: hypothetical protein ACO1NQ_06075 [Flavobacteriales bacterium]
MFRFCLFLVAVHILFAGCSTSQDVVGHGPFQKRKYRPGWHVSWASSEETSSRPSIPRSTVSPLVAKTSARQVPTAEPLVATTAEAIRIERTPQPEPGMELRQESVKPTPVVSTGTDQLEDVAPSEGTAEPRRWNRLALISGIFLVLSIVVGILTGAGGIFPYLLTFSFLTGLIGLLLAIKHKERGKGIAIAAMAWPVVIIALVIAALNLAW